MSVALNKEYNSPLRTLISADMAAARGKISKEQVTFQCDMFCLRAEDQKGADTRNLE
jgi:hypothetical protein